MRGRTGSRTRRTSSTLLGMTRRTEDSGGLVGRDDVLARLAELVATLTGGGADRVAVVGAPGTGRTAVLDDLAARVSSSRSPVTVLRAHPVAAEASLAHAGL